MAIKNYTGIIPEQYAGKEIVAEASAVFEDDTAAMRFYEVAKQRLLDCNNWHKIADGISATFQLFDKDGIEETRKVEKGGYLKIDIPAPGSKAGKGYDWVTIEELKEIAENDVQSIGFRVRPTANPNGDTDNIAHFYAESATSNFIITREVNKVTATIVDRNTQPNKDAGSVVDKVRDTAIGVSALTAFSKVQWQNLADGLAKLDTYTMGQ